MKRFKSWGPAIIRLVLGIIFIVHGWGKVQGLWGWLIHGHEWPLIGFVSFMPFLPEAFWAICATAAEFLGGVLVFLGYWPRLGALGIATVMVAALLGIHLPKGMEPEVSLLNEVELPLALLAMAVSLILTGPGSYSVKLKK